MHPGVNTLEDYRRKHAEALARGRLAYPNLDWPTPWVSSVHPPVFVSGGMWQVRCATPGCGNAPMVSPEWRVALCWDCGAVYEGLAIPADAAEIERVLVLRQHLGWRNWNWPMLDGSESVDVLRAQNLEMGDVI